MPGPSTSSAIPGRQAGRPDRTQRVPARLDQGPEYVVHGVRKRVQRGHRHGQLLGQGAGKPAADPDLEAELADVLVPAADSGDSLRSPASCRR